jgi:hypothetical protein
VDTGIEIDIVASLIAEADVSESEVMNIKELD